MTLQTEATTASSRAHRERFWFERPGEDLPFYNGRPVALPFAGWAAMLLAIAAGFGSLMLPIPALQAGIGSLLPPILFFAMPLATLALVAPEGWTCLFRKVRLRDLGWMIAFALLNLVVTLSVGYVVDRLLGSTANPIIKQLNTASSADLLLMFGRTIPQLFGEEVLTILPFLAVVTLLHGPAGVSRRWSIVVGWIASAALFGALHLPTYNWNLAQCLLIIGSARLVLTIPYIMTKNIWVSTGAHIVNDWSLFFSAIVLSKYV